MLCLNAPSLVTLSLSRGLREQQAYLFELALKLLLVALEIVAECGQLLVIGCPLANRCRSILGDADPSLLHGVNDCLRAVVDRQLAQDRAHVVLDGLLADRQRVGDLLVGHALGDVVENLDLARRKRREDGRGFLAVDRQLAELLEHARGHGRAGEDLVVDQVLAGADATDDRDEIIRADVLEDERGGARLDRLEQLVLVLGDGKGDDARRWALRA